MDYLLRYLSQTMLRIVPNFVESIDDNVPTDEERQLYNLDDESQEEDAGDDVDLRDEDSDADVADM